MVSYMYVISKGAEGAKKYFTYIYLFIINIKIRLVLCISSDSANVFTWPVDYEQNIWRQPNMFKASLHKFSEGLRLGHFGKSKWKKCYIAFRWTLSCISSMITGNSKLIIIVPVFRLSMVGTLLRMEIKK